MKALLTSSGVIGVSGLVATEAAWAWLGSVVGNLGACCSEHLLPHFLLSTACFVSDLLMRDSCCLTSGQVTRSFLQHWADERIIGWLHPECWVVLDLALLGPGSARSEGPGGN